MKKLIIFFMFFVLLLTGCGAPKNEYNEAGKITKEYTESGYTTYEYDENGILLKEIQYDNNGDHVQAIEHSIELNEDGGFTSQDLIYDSNGNLSSVDGRIYDNRANLISNSSITFDENKNIKSGTITGYIYDEDGNLIEEACTDENLNIIYHKYYEYNVYGLSKTIIYDSEGNMTEELS